MSVRLHRIVCALALALATLAGSGAGAQVLAPDRVRGELEMTDKRIELASAVVAESPSAAASGELSIAQQLQAKAWAQFSSALYGLALRATLDARQHADRATAMVRGLPDPDRVDLQVERTRDILERARDGIEACDNLRARAMSGVAVEMQSRAEKAAAESRYLAALQLTMSARERIYRAMRLCHLEESIRDAAERALQRTDDVLARANEASESPEASQAHELLRRAAAVQANAQAELRNGRAESALRLTQSARVMALRVQRAARDAGGRPRR